MQKAGMRTSEKPKTKYEVKAYFIGTKTLRELIERLAVKDAKEIINKK